MLPVRADLHADFVIVGSGAGGSVLAYHLARHGARVLVLERGPRLHPRDLTHDEAAMIASIYKDGGAQTNNTADMFVLQGSCVGGSTVLTNAVCFRMPEDVRRSFGGYGFDLPRDRLDRAFARVESVLNVGPLPEELHNPATARLTDGMRRTGLRPGGFAKAMLDCIGCGYCNVGCRYGRKLDAARTWIPMAEAHGARVEADVEVMHAEHRGGVVHALRCRDRATGQPFRVRGSRFVFAAGAIGTPELLLRSGIHRRTAGRRTSFNAGAIVFGDFDEPLDGFDGDQMCVHAFGDRWVAEQIQNPPVSLALTLAGFGREHAARMHRYRHLAAMGVLVPTQPTGRVFLGLGHRLLRRAFDHADISFRMDRGDLAAFRDGCAAMARALLAAGANRVYLPIASPTVITAPEQLARIDELMRDQRDLVGFGSSHPQGGACCGDVPTRDVTGPDFRVHGFTNLFVADASLFPHSVRVNPMLSIMAVADLAVQHVGGFAPAERIDEGPAHDARRRAMEVR